MGRPPTGRRRSPSSPAETGRTSEHPRAGRVGRPLAIHPAGASSARTRTTSGIGPVLRVRRGGSWCRRRCPPRCCPGRRAERRRCVRTGERRTGPMPSAGHTDGTTVPPTVSPPPMVRGFAASRRTVGGAAGCWKRFPTAAHRSFSCSFCACRIPIGRLPDWLVGRLARSRGGRSWPWASLAA